MQKVDVNQLKKYENGRYDQWGFIGPGGGGAMFNPAINPSDSNNVFLSSDMTGSFVTYNGGESWRMFNLRGVTKFFSFDKNDENIVYTATSNFLYKSEDKGTSWRVIYPNPKDVMAIHSQGDHADEVVITKDSTFTIIDKMVVDIDDSNKLYLIKKKKHVEYWKSFKDKEKRYDTYIISSNNGGKTWENSKVISFNMNNVFIDPKRKGKDSRIYLSGIDGSGMIEHHMLQKMKMPHNIRVFTQIIDGFDKKNNSHTLYALSGKPYFNPNGINKKSKIFRSLDGDDKWKRIDFPLQKLKIKNSEEPIYRSIATSYKHPETIYVSYSNLQIAKDTMSFGIAKSSDYGKTWSLVWNDKIVSRKDTSFQISSKNREQGWLDQRFGPSWGENPFHMAVDVNNPNICYATDFGRIIKTLDGGLTWQQVYTNEVTDSTWTSRGLQVTTGYMLAFDPLDSLHVFMANTDIGLMQSYDGAKTWQSATKNNGVPKHWVNSTYWLTFDPKVKDRVWAVMSANHDLPRAKMWKNKDFSDFEGGILLSNNGGKTWQPISKDIGETAPTHILLDEKSDINNRTLYVCAFGKGVYKSTDGGESWQLKNKGISGESPATWRLTKNEQGDLYLIVFRKSDDGKIGNEEDGALYKSIDGAETWVKMNLPKGVNGPSSIVVDVKNKERLLLSAWGRYGETKFSPNQGGGIYLSNNDGESWQAVLTKDQQIHDITYDEKQEVYYAVGFNSSAYRSEDNGETWIRIKGYNFKWGKHVQPDPHDKDKIYIITFGGGVWHGPAKGDENAFEDIITPVVKVK